MKRQLAAAIVVLSAIASLAGPAVSPAWARSAKKDLTIAFYEKRVQDLSGEGLLLNFVFRVTNSSGQAWYATGYDYRVVIENVEYFSVRNTLPQAITLAPSAATLIALPVKVTNTNLFKAVPSAESRDKLGCYLIGGMNFAEGPNSEGDRLPMACSGDFPVYRDIALDFRPLEVRMLTIGGGDLTFRAEVSNGNAFPVRLESLSYTLEFGGVRVSVGNLQAVGEVEAKGVKEITIPLLLDFFELGNALYGLLQQATIPGKFAGQAVIETDWGRFAVPLDKLEAIPVAPAR